MQNNPRRELGDPKDSTDSKPRASGGEPKGAEKNGDKPDPDGKPPKAETGEPPANQDPSWYALLPEDVRRAVTAGNVESLPPRWQRWIRWLRDHAADGSSSGR